MTPLKRIAVIGGGMAGLASVYELAKMARQGAPVGATLFEASGRLGGTVETVRHDGFVLECGPDGWVTEKPWARELAIELGLEDEMIPSNDAQRRTYLLQAGRLEPMPDGLRMMVPSNWAPLLASPLLSAQAKLAYLREPKRAVELKTWAANHPEDESVSALVRRHFGDEVTEKLAAPLLSGVFGGDVARLSAHAVMAPFVKMEREHGSLVLPIQQRARAGSGRTSVFTSLRNGVGSLVDAMTGVLTGAATDELGISLRLCRPVSSIERNGDRWSVRSAGGTDTGGVDLFDAVIIAAPAHVASELLRPLDARSAELLTMEASSAIIVAFGFAPDHARRLRWPRGFGFLVPAQAAPTTSGKTGDGGAPPLPHWPQQGSPTANSLLAATFLDQKFEGRAPAGGKLLRAFFGGAEAARLTGESDAALAAIARGELERVLGPLPEASVTLVRRWPRSLPQYEVGHLVRVAELERRIDSLPGLRLVGNAYHGVGLPDLVREGRCATQEIARKLAPAQPATA